MNIQNTIVFILGFTILCTTMLIIIVGFLGVLRVMIMSVFEYDYVKSFKNWTHKKKEKEEQKFKEVHRDTQMGLYKVKGDE